MSNPLPPSTAPAPRARCPQCARPVELCLCHLVPDLLPRTTIVVIQHPDERRHALNTARLLVAGLRNGELVVAEQLPQQWKLRLGDPAWRTELLFPGPQVPGVVRAADDTRTRQLVLYDGTRRKARRQRHHNP